MDVASFLMKLRPLVTQGKCLSCKKKNQKELFSMVHENTNTK